MPSTRVITTKQPPSQSPLTFRIQSNDNKNSSSSSSNTNNNTTINPDNLSIATVSSATSTPMAKTTIKTLPMTTLLAMTTTTSTPMAKSPTKLVNDFALILQNESKHMEIIEKHKLSTIQISQHQQKRPSLFNQTSNINMKQQTIIIEEPDNNHNNGKSKSNFSIVSVQRIDNENGKEAKEQVQIDDKVNDDEDVNNDNNRTLMIKPSASKVAAAARPLPPPAPAQPSPATTTLILAPSGKAVAGNGGTATSETYSKAIILGSNSNTLLLYRPDSVAIAGSGGIAHAQADLDIWIM